MSCDMQGYPKFVYWYNEINTVYGDKSYSECLTSNILLVVKIQAIYALS